MTLTRPLKLVLELPEDSNAYLYRAYAKKKYAVLMHQDEGLSFDRAVRMETDWPMNLWNI